MPQLGTMARGWSDVAGAFAQDARSHKRPSPESGPRPGRPEKPAVWLLLIDGLVFDVLVGSRSDAEVHAAEWGATPHKATPEQVRVLHRSGQLDNL